VTREAVGLGAAIDTVLERGGQALDTLARQLEALSHTSVLERGYAIVRSRASGALLPTAAAASGESDMVLLFADGELAVRRSEARAAGRRGRQELPEEQGRLL
jgi:exodeoxyribonuclease VII large subunit